MKMISDSSAFPPEGVRQCRRFGNWGIGYASSIKYAACSQHLSRVLTILYAEDVSPLSVVPLRKPAGV